MVRLKADFKTDMYALARCELANTWGYEAQKISDDRILMVYFDSLRRRPSIRPRLLRISDDFQCPPAHEDGWKLLQEKIVSGSDLAPHLSYEHASLDSQDGLLNEWGVHHFHLGTIESLKRAGFIGRTGPVLLARITPDEFYAINVYPHGEWENFSIVESLHRNWSDSIKQYRLNGIKGEPLSNLQRRNIRRVNMQAATAVADGTVYMAIGGGVCSSGASSEAVRVTDMLLVDLQNLQISIQNQIENFIPNLALGGYLGESEVRACLRGITPKGFEVYFPDYSVCSVVTLVGGWFHRK